VLSQTAQYALRATVYLTEQSPRVVRLPEIAAAVGAPANYLSKILGKLARAGILRSTRGPAGGFRVASDQERVSLASVVAVFATTARRRCVLGRGVCNSRAACRAHERWSPIADSMSSFLRDTTVADLLPLRPHSSRSS
jgi:Rrf2 family protein